jgi:nitroreductase
MLSIKYSQPVSDLIRKRFSCRTYLSNPISAAHLAALDQCIQSCQLGPLGTRSRFKIIASQEGDSHALNGLGTYGFIKNPAGFICGACQDLPGTLEDFGYLLEAILLKSTELGIGTCWLGGTFTKSRFAQAIELEEGEIIPSVASIGYPADGQAWIDRISRLYSGADRRKPWEEIFFLNSYGTALPKTIAGEYHESLEMVRFAPSASNKQPWRIVKINHKWHFYLSRTPNYPSPIFVFLIDLADLQRIDLGIAMAHFELSSRERGLDGEWIVENPGIDLADELIEYTVTWQEYI